MFSIVLLLQVFILRPSGGIIRVYSGFTQFSLVAKLAKHTAFTEGWIKYLIALTTENK